MSGLPLLVAILALTIVALAHAQAGFAVQLESAPDSQRDQRRLFTLVGEPSAFEFRFSDVVGPSRVDNAAVLQLQQDKIFNKFLATLPGQGQAQFLTVIKPCGILLPHEHPRATEFYSVIFGTMSSGIAQENGALQNITFNTEPGEVFIVPQGLLHFNHNQLCTPLAFFQSFNSADPIPINVINALASLGLNPAGKPSIRASGALGLRVSPFGAFNLDTVCLKRCGFPATGAPNGGLDGLPDIIKRLFGI